MTSTSSLLLPTTGEEFKFIEETHTYLLGEKKLPSITGIIRDCGYSDTRFYTEEARTRGSHVHLAIKFLNKRTLDWSSVLDKYLGYVMAYEKFARDWNLVVRIFELPMFHRLLLFAGMPDLIGTVLDGVPAIIELKTGVVPRWAALQTMAQELLIRAWEPKQTIRYRRWGVTLNADGTYSKPKEFKDFERDEAVFRMLNTAVQTFGEKTKSVFDLFGALSPEQRAAAATPLINSVVEHRELYAA